MCEITIRPGSPISSGQLCITGKCQSPINLLKFFDQWYDGETVMQLHYGPVGVYFTGQDENGMWMSITDDEAKEIRQERRRTAQPVWRPTVPS